MALHMTEQLRSRLNVPEGGEKLQAGMRTIHGHDRFTERSPSRTMQDFANAAFTPETIAAMERAMQSAVASLPEPVSSTHVDVIVESILRTAKEGERDPATLERLALLELQIRPRD